MRLWTNYVTTAANASEQTFDFTTEDDYRYRDVKTVHVGIATSGVQLGLYTGGQEFSTIDCTRFAAGDSPLHVNFRAKAGIKIQVSLKNLAGAALTNVPITIGYEPDPTVGP